MGAGRMNGERSAMLNLQTAAYRIGTTAAFYTIFIPWHHLGSEVCRMRTPNPPALGIKRAQMHKSRLANIVIDCQTSDLLSAAQFWSSALGYPLPQELGTTSKFLQLVTPPGEVQVIIQRVSHEARAHLDIETDSIESDVSRLERLGAAVVSRKDGWVVMQAPSGHRFCVGNPYRGGFEQRANTWE